MEKEIIIKEEKYQKIKMIMNKKDDLFSIEEYKQFTNIYNSSGEIQAKHI